MSEYSPTFVNWDETASRTTNGFQAERGRRSPPATDLHIVFNKGGIEIKDNGTEAEKAEYGDDRRNSVDLTFPGDRPINSSPYMSPAALQPNGTVSPPPTALPGTSTKPTFTHPDPKFPGIKEWWWTRSGKRSSRVFRGDPAIVLIAEPTKRSRRGAE
jgi:hypothetical protein